MSSVVIAGNTSGTVTLQAPAVAGTTVLTLPATSGTILQSGTAVTIAQGGTNNGSLAVTAGGVVYTDGSALQNVGAGTTGQFIKSQGSSSPVWSTTKEDASNNLLFNSGYGSAATAYGCRAWVNFNGSTGARNGNGNVSSVTRTSTGQYTIALTNAMPDANYAPVIGGSYATGDCRMIGSYATSTTSVAMTSINISGAYLDLNQGYMAIFR